MKKGQINDFDFGIQDHLLTSKRQLLLSELKEFEPDIHQSFLESPATTAIIR